MENENNETVNLLQKSILELKIADIFDDIKDNENQNYEEPGKSFKKLKCSSY